MFHTFGDSSSDFQRIAEKYGILLELRTEMLQADRNPPNSIQHNP